MKKKKTEQKPIPKQINDLEEFQSAYGEQWQQITSMPAFRAGLQLLNVRSLDQIAALSNEEIEKYGLLILSSLVGLLKHENEMFNLHNEQTFKFPLDEEVEYISPEEEAEHQKLRQQFQTEERKKRYGN